MSLAAISLTDAGRQWFKSIPDLSLSGEALRRGSFCGQVIPPDDILIVPDARRDPRFAADPLVVGEARLAFHAGVPIRGVGGVHVGAMWVADRAPRTLSADEIETLRDLAALAEIGLCASMEKAVQSDLLEQIATEQQRALFDPLCRVWNRAGLGEVLEQEYERARRENGAISLLMVDLDHFKAVNDEHGHTVGDEVLREAAKRMLEAVRGIDVIGRYGGDEFTVVPGRQAGLQAVMRIAERLRTTVGQGPVLTESGPVPVTASVGVAFAERASDVTPHELVATADAALYRAKHDGRNRIEHRACGAGVVSRAA
jgi:diguanylate cyclase (GGDEF)-like protein